MAIQAFSSAEINRIAAAGLEQVRARRGDARIANLRAVRELSEPEAIAFRGRRYPMPRPLSADAGFALLELAERASTALAKPGEPGAAARYRREIRATMDLCWSLLRPPGWRGLFWLCRPNRFRQATIAEARDILGFFGRCRTSSLDRHR